MVSEWRFKFWSFAARVPPACGRNQFGFDEVRKAPLHSWKALHNLCRDHKHAYVKETCFEASTARSLGLGVQLGSGRTFCTPHSHALAGSVVTTFRLPFVGMGRCGGLHCFRLGCTPQSWWDLCCKEARPFITTRRGWDHPFCNPVHTWTETRHSGPRHQAAKLDAPDLLQVVDLAFGEKTEGTRLWEKSGQTLRMRSKELLRELRLPLEKFNGMKPLDLGSLRAGGATWHLQITENSEYCRRKGRWINMKTMEIYVQETTSILYLKRIPSEARTKVLTVANLFPKILQRSIALQQANVPKNVWYALHNQEDLWRWWDKWESAAEANMLQQPVTTER